MLLVLFCFSFYPLLNLQASWLFDIVFGNVHGLRLFFQSQSTNILHSVLIVGVIASSSLVLWVIPSVVIPNLTNRHMLVICTCHCFFSPKKFLLLNFYYYFKLKMILPTKLWQDASLWLGSVLVALALPPAWVMAPLLPILSHKTENGSSTELVKSWCFGLYDCR